MFAIAMIRTPSHLHWSLLSSNRCFVNYLDLFVLFDVVVNSVDWDCIMVAVLYSNESIVIVVLNLLLIVRGLPENFI